MTDRYQAWQWGEPNPVETKAVPTATVIESGDLIAVDGSDLPYAAADEAWSTNLAGTQENFHDKFLGVSHDRSRAGDVLPIRVNTSGVHLFDCASATWELGDLVGPADSGSSTIMSKKVVSVATANLAVGRVARREGTATTKVYVEIFSTVLRGGPQAMA